MKRAWMLMINPDLAILTAFSIGLFSGLHCLAMCGGMASGGSQIYSAKTMSNGRHFLHLLTYNSGRLFSYGLLGGIAGFSGGELSEIMFGEQGWVALHVIAGSFLIAMALYVTGWWKGLARLERLGSGLWARLRPFASQFLPMDTNIKALKLGLLWGALPCGLVYSGLAWAASTGHWLSGMSVMMMFGLGTMPWLLLMGAGAYSVMHWLRQPAFRLYAGILIFTLGIWVLMTAFVGMSHTM